MALLALGLGSGGPSISIPIPGGSDLRNLYRAAENTSGGWPGPRFLILLGAMVFNITGGGSGPIFSLFFFRDRPPGGLAAPERLFTSPEEILKKLKISKIL